MPRSRKEMWIALLAVAALNGCLEPDENMIVKDAGHPHDAGPTQTRSKPTTKTRVDAGQDAGHAAVLDASADDAGSVDAASGHQNYRPAPDPEEDGGCLDGGCYGYHYSEAITNAECDSPLTDAPEWPQVNWDRASGRPRFDLWRDIACDDAVAVSTCTKTSSGPCGTCLIGGGTTGVCTHAPIDSYCGDGSEAIGVSPWCVTCAPPMTHARACCLGLDVDCRAWPYPADGKRGTVCARHEDCEAGLYCGTNPRSSGFGLCRCPNEGLPDLFPLFGGADDKGMCQKHIIE